MFFSHRVDISDEAIVNVDLVKPRVDDRLGASLAEQSVKLEASALGK